MVFSSTTASCFKLFSSFLDEMIGYRIVSLALKIFCNNTRLAMFMVVTEYFVVKKCGGSLALKIFCAMFMVVSEYFVVKSNAIISRHYVPLKRFDNHSFPPKTKKTL